ncbi:MAG: 2'-5' RNA ligase family protein [Lachnospiraceae bacterium]|nr:2'-5' RNA ligase family protein [Lachnospiraceae bacterium]
MQKAADASGNTDMTDRAIPPHITLSVFESRENVKKIIMALDKVFDKVNAGQIQWVSVAAFFPHVLYLLPVLNEYLNRMLVKAAGAIELCKETRIQECYRPFCWQPHTTVARRLTKEKMRRAFEGLQNCFRPFSGTVVRIGLSEGNLKKELKSWELK